MNSTLARVLRITLPLSGMNFLTQCARAGLAVVGPVLAVEYGLSASQLGLLSAVMFAAYGLWQLPVGLLLDMWGPRAVQSSMAATAAVGFLLFAASDSYAGFVAARLVLGFGVASGLMGMMKGISLWFPRTQLAGMTGIGLVLGGLGGLAATSPVAALMPTVGWRGVFVIFACIAATVSLWNLLSLRDPPGLVRRRQGLAVEIATLGRVLRDRGFWRYTPMVAYLSVLNFTYQSLWAGPWLRDVAGMNPTQAAGGLFIYALGMMAGSFAFGQLASRLTERGLPPIAVPAACTLVLILLQGLLALGPTTHWQAIALWAVLGAFSSSGPSGYAAIANVFPPDVMGRVTTAINATMLATTFALQAAIGWILDLWPRAASGGWDAAGYGWALGLSALLQAVTALWALRRGGSAQ